MPLSQITLGVFRQQLDGSPLPADARCYATEDNELLGVILPESNGWAFRVYRRNAAGSFALEAQHGSYLDPPECEMRGKLQELITLAEIERRRR